MEIKHYAIALLRWAWLIVLGGALGGGIAFWASTQMVPTYESSARFLVHQPPANNGYDPLFTSNNLPRTVGELLRTRPVLEAVISRLQLGIGAETLARHVTVVVSRDSQLVVLTAEDPDPQRAADIANGIVTMFGEQNRELQARRYSTSRQNLQAEMARTLSDVVRTQASLDALKVPIQSGPTIEPDQSPPGDNASGVGLMEELEIDPSVGQSPPGGNASGAANRAAAPATPERTAEQIRLQVFLTQYQTSYQGLFQSVEKLRLAEIQQTDTLLVVEPAQATTSPARPRPLLNTVLAAIIGALLVAGAVFLGASFGAGVRSREQVERSPRVPTQGVGARADGSDPVDVTGNTTGTVPALAIAARALKLKDDIDRQWQNAKDRF